MLSPLLLLVLAATNGNSDAGRDLLKGSALLRTCQAEARLMDLPSLTRATRPDLIDGAYCVGFLNGFTGTLNSAKDSICTNGASMGAVVRSYIEFMEKNPKLLDEDRRVGVRMALQDAFPCPVSQPSRLASPSGAQPRVL